MHAKVETYGVIEGMKKNHLPGRKVTLHVISPHKPWHCWFHGVIIHILSQCHDRLLANPNADCQVLMQPYLQGAASRSSIKMPEVLHCQVRVYVYVWG